MLNYQPLWNIMQKQGITTYTLINKYNINPHTLNNLKHNKSITMYTLEKLCSILDCTPNDIIKFEQQE